MKRLFLLIIAVVFAMGLGLRGFAQAADKPNILLIVSDDTGWKFRLLVGQAVDD